MVCKRQRKLPELPLPSAQVAVEKVLAPNDAVVVPFSGTACTAQATLRAELVTRNYWQAEINTAFREVSPRS